MDGSGKKKNQKKKIVIFEGAINWKTGHRVFTICPKQKTPSMSEEHLEI